MTTTTGTPSDNGSGTPPSDPPASSAGFGYPLRTKITVVAVLTVAIGGFVLAAQTMAPTEDPGLTVSGTPAQTVDEVGIDAVYPGPDDEVLAQQRFGIDLEAGWTGELTFVPATGPAVPLSAGDVTLVPELGQIFYQPHTGGVIERLPGGRNCVSATIWSHVRGRSASERTKLWCFSVV